MSRKALGRGLSALFTQMQTSESDLIDLDIDLLYPTESQPRRVFNQEKLNELAQSIKVNGIIQPIVARRDGERFQIIAGERRWRAAQMAGLQKIPCLIREVADDSVLEISLIENIQREDLNPIEEATAYKRLIDNLSLSQEEVAKRVGKDRSSVTNALRLLRLPTEIQQLVEEEKLSMGHGRALLALDAVEDQLQLAKEIIEKSLSVRETERLVKEGQAAETGSEMPRNSASNRKDPNIAAAEQKLGKALGAPARIKFLKEGGVLEIKFSSSEDLSRLFDLLVQRSPQ
ncbi:MAG TPA: ParB/RepB/Spo0J family partition protein [Blastocatellia bacterium]|nr:ParB/RepB/Spo0J family partition protein [Blastocatellia bacterium]